MRRDLFFRNPCRILVYLRLPSLLPLKFTPLRLGLCFPGPGSSGQNDMVERQDDASNFVRLLHWQECMLCIIFHQFCEKITHITVTGKHMKFCDLRPQTTFREVKQETKQGEVAHPLGCVLLVTPLCKNTIPYFYSSKSSSAFSFHSSKK